MEEFILEEKYIRDYGRFKRIKYINQNDCWVCISHNGRENNGYMEICRNSKRQYMHRYIYELFKGEIPEDKVVMHTCDNRRCINPEHLKLGTYKDNSQDMVNKGRNSHVNKGIKRTGEQKKKYSKLRSKLNDKQLLEIKSLLVQGKRTDYVCTLFNVSERTIRNIKLGKSYYSEQLGGGLNDW